MNMELVKIGKWGLANMLALNFEKKICIFFVQVKKNSDTSKSVAYV